MTLIYKKNKTEVVDRFKCCSERLSVILNSNSKLFKESHSSQPCTLLEIAASAYPQCAASPCLSGACSASLRARAQLPAPRVLLLSALELIALLGWCGQFVVINSLLELSAPLFPKVFTHCYHTIITIPLNKNITAIIITELKTLVVVVAGWQSDQGRLFRGGLYTVDLIYKCVVRVATVVAFIRVMRVSNFIRSLALQQQITTTASMQPQPQPQETTSSEALGISICTYAIIFWS